MKQLTLEPGRANISESDTPYRILLDFGAVKSGGGAQLAINFLDRLEEDVHRHSSVYLLLPSVGPISEKPLKGNYAGRLYSPSSYFRRVVFEMQLPSVLRNQNIDVVYSFMGAGIPCPENVRSIVTVAYPIICYPDSPYWRHVDLRAGSRKKLLNMLRRSRLRKATRILTETDVMRQRLAKALKKKEEDFGLLLPAATDYLDGPTRRQASADRANFVYLTGTDPHKNVWRLYGLAQQMSTQITEFTFTLTIKEHAFRSILKEVSVDDELISKHFRFIGVVSPDRVAEVYAEADFVVNLSDLESFSNNYHEAWKAQLPIIASDRDFARSICRGSAYYVEPHDIPATAERIVALVGDLGLREKLAREGAALIRQHPTNQERYDAIWTEIDQMLAR